MEGSWARAMLSETPQSTQASRRAQLSPLRGHGTHSAAEAFDSVRSVGFIPSSVRTDRKGVLNRW